MVFDSLEAARNYFAGTDNSNETFNNNPLEQQQPNENPWARNGRALGVFERIDDGETAATGFDYADSFGVDGGKAWSTVISATPVGKKWTSALSDQYTHYLEEVARTGDPSKYNSFRNPMSWFGDNPTTVNVEDWEDREGKFFAMAEKLKNGKVQAFDDDGNFLLGSGYDGMRKKTRDNRGRIIYTNELDPVYFQIGHDEAKRRFVASEAEGLLKDNLGNRKTAQRELEEDSSGAFTRAMSFAIENSGLATEYLLYRAYCGGPIGSFIGSTATSFMQRYCDLTSDELDVDSNGNIVITAAADDIGSAALKAAGGAIAENALEMVGGTAVDVVVGKVLSKLLKPMSKAVPPMEHFFSKKTKMWKPGTRDVFKGFWESIKGAKRKANISGVFGEGFEEWTQGIADEVFGLGLHDDEDSKTLAEFNKEFFKEGNFEDLVCGIIGTQLMMGGFGGVHAGYKFHKAANASKKFLKNTHLLSKEEAGQMSHTEREALARMFISDSEGNDFESAKDTLVRLGANEEELDKMNKETVIAAGHFFANRFMSPNAKENAVEAEKLLNLLSGNVREMTNRMIERAALGENVKTLDQYNADVNFDFNNFHTDERGNVVVTDNELGISIVNIKGKNQRFFVVDAHGETLSNKNIDKKIVYGVRTQEEALRWAGRAAQRIRQQEDIKLKKNASIEKIAKRLMGGTQFSVYESVEQFKQEFPDANVQTTDEKGNPFAIPGFIDLTNGKNQVAFFLDGIDSVADIINVMLHENGWHNGIRQLYGEAELTKILKRLDTNGMVRKVRTDKVDSLYADMDDATRNEEAVAEIVEMRNANPSAYNRLVFEIRNFLRKKFPNMGFLDSDIKCIIEKAQKASVENGDGTNIIRNQHTFNPNKDSPVGGVKNQAQRAEERKQEVYANRSQAQQKDDGHGDWDQTTEENTSPGQGNQFATAVNETRKIAEARQRVTSGEQANKTEQAADSSKPSPAISEPTTDEVKPEAETAEPADPPKVKKIRKRLVPETKPETPTPPKVKTARKQTGILPVEKSEDKVGEEHKGEENPAKKSPKNKEESAGVIPEDIPPSNPVSESKSEKPAEPADPPKVKKIRKRLVPETKPETPTPPKVKTARKQTGILPVEKSEDKVGEEHKGEENPAKKSPKNKEESAGVIPEDIPPSNPVSESKSEKPAKPAKSVIAEVESKTESPSADEQKKDETFGEDDIHAGVVEKYEPIDEHKPDTSRENVLKDPVGTLRKLRLAEEIYDFRSKHKYSDCTKDVLQALKDNFLAKFKEEIKTVPDAVKAWNALGILTKADVKEANKAQFAADRKARLNKGKGVIESVEDKAAKQEKIGKALNDMRGVAEEVCSIANQVKEELGAKGMRSIKGNERHLINQLCKTNAVSSEMLGEVKLYDRDGNVVTAERIKQLLEIQNQYGSSNTVNIEERVAKLGALSSVFDEEAAQKIADSKKGLKETPKPPEGITESKLEMFNNPIKTLKAKLGDEFKSWRDQEEQRLAEVVGKEAMEDFEAYERRRREKDITYKHNDTFTNNWIKNRYRILMNEKLNEQFLNKLVGAKLLTADEVETMKSYMKEVKAVVRANGEKGSAANMAIKAAQAEAIRIAREQMEQENNLTPEQKLIKAYKVRSDELEDKHFSDAMFGNRTNELPGISEKAKEEHYKDPVAGCLSLANMVMNKDMAERMVQGCKDMHGDRYAKAVAIRCLMETGKYSLNKFSLEDKEAFISLQKQLGYRNKVAMHNVKLGNMYQLKEEFDRNKEAELNGIIDRRGKELRFSRKENKLANKENDINESWDDQKKDMLSRIKNNKLVRLVKESQREQKIKLKAALNNPSRKRYKSESVIRLPGSDQKLYVHRDKYGNLVAHCPIESYDDVSVSSKNIYREIRKGLQKATKERDNQAIREYALALALITDSIATQTPHYLRLLSGVTGETKNKTEIDRPNASEAVHSADKNTFYMNNRIADLRYSGKVGPIEFYRNSIERSAMLENEINKLVEDRNMLQDAINCIVGKGNIDISDILNTELKLGEEKREYDYSITGSGKLGGIVPYRYKEIISAIKDKASKLEQTDDIKVLIDNLNLLSEGDEMDSDYIYLGACIEMLQYSLADFYKAGGGDGMHKQIQAYINPNNFLVIDCDGFRWSHLKQQVREQTDIEIPEKPKNDDDVPSDDYCEFGFDLDTDMALPLDFLDEHKDIIGGERMSTDEIVRAVRKDKRYDGVILLNVQDSWEAYKKGAVMTDVVPFKPDYSSRSGDKITAWNNKEIDIDKRFKPGNSRKNFMFSRQTKSDIVSKFEDSEKWMKAPNGNKTNLNEEKWVESRTDDFKNEYGDWELANIAKRITALKGIDVERHDPMTKDEVKELFKRFGVCKNAESKRIAIFPSSMAGKVLRHKGFSTSEIIEAFKPLYESSILAIENEQNDGHKEHGNILGYDHFVNKFTCDGKEYYIRFTLPVVKKSDGHGYVHSSAISEIGVYNKNEEVLHFDSSFIPAQLGTSSKTNNAEHSFVDNKIAKILNAVNDVSVQLDENGEPIFENGEPKVLLSRKYKQNATPNAPKEAVDAARAILNGGQDTNDNIKGKLKEMWTTVRRKIQDAQIDVKNLEEKFKLSHKDSFYYALDRAHGLNEYHQQNLMEEHIEPIAKKLAELGIKEEDFNIFLLAMGGKERNKMIFSKTKGKVKDGSGMSDAHCDEIINGLKKDGRFNDMLKVGEMVWKMNFATLDRLVASGRLSSTQAEYWKKHSPHYVPYRTDIGNNESGNLLFGEGGRYSTYEYHHARGRTSAADSPLRFSFLQASQAINRTTDNDARKKLAAFVKAHSELGSIHSEDKTHSLPDFNHDNIVPFKEDGIIKWIELNDYQGIKANLVGRAAKKASFQNMGLLQKFLEPTTRMFSLMRTAFSPEFVVSNMISDDGQCVRNIAAQFGARAALRFQSYVASALASAHRLHEGKLKNAKKLTELDKAALSWQKNGGMIGGYTMATIRDVDKKMKGDIAFTIDRLVGRRVPPKLWGKYLTNLAEKLNAPVEMGMRIAAYQTAKENGMSEAEAISFSRDVTVNFNRKGEWTPVLNSLYAFSNAAIQGIHRSGVAGAGAHGIKMMGTMTVIALIANILNGAGDDDDDAKNGLPQWKDTADYVKDNNICFRVGDKFVKIPVRGVDRIPLKIANSIAKMANGGDAMKEIKDITKFALSTIVDPIGDAPTVAQTVTPSLVRPGVELMQNKSFSGAPIYRDSPDRYAVKSELGRNSTSGIWHSIARLVNTATGGNVAKSGAIDYQPEAYRHLAQWLTGSVGTDLARWASAIPDTVKGNMDIRNMPFVRRVASKLGENSSAYYEALDKYRIATREVKNAKDTGDLDLYRNAVKDAPYLKGGSEQWLKMLDDTQKIVMKLQKMEASTRDDNERKEIKNLRMIAQYNFIKMMENSPFSKEFKGGNKVHDIFGFNRRVGADIKQGEKAIKEEKKREKRKFDMLLKR